MKMGTSKKHLIPEQWYEYPGVSNETLKHMAKHIIWIPLDDNNSNKKNDKCMCAFSVLDKLITLPPFTSSNLSLYLGSLNSLHIKRNLSQIYCIVCVKVSSWIRMPYLPTDCPAFRSAQGRYIINQASFSSAFDENYEQNQECFWRNKYCQAWWQKICLNKVLPHSP